MMFMLRMNVWHIGIVADRAHVTSSERNKGDGDG